MTRDVTPAAVAQALEMRMNCIVSHHPIIFHPLKAHQRAGCGGLCLANGISVISAHTNYDFAPRGELRPGANAGAAEYPALWPGI